MLNHLTLSTFTTFSIVAFDPSTGDIGIAVASKHPAVGAAVPHVQAQTGAIAIQSWMERDAGQQALNLMADGHSPTTVIDMLVKKDPFSRTRQYGLVSSNGSSDTFTGECCLPWAGGIHGNTFACQGNLLDGSHVIEAMVRTYHASKGDLTDRLLASLAAGDESGGDKRGKQSAAIVVARPGGAYSIDRDKYLDLRCDDHPHPIDELQRLLMVYDANVLFRSDRAIPLTENIVQEVYQSLVNLEYINKNESSNLNLLDEGLQRFQLEHGMRNKILRDGLIYESVLRKLKIIDDWKDIM